VCQAACLVISIGHTDQCRVDARRRRSAGQGRPCFAPRHFDRPPVVNPPTPPFATESSLAASGGGRPLTAHWIGYLTTTYTFLAQIAASCSTRPEGRHGRAGDGGSRFSNHRNVRRVCMTVVVTRADEMLIVAAGVDADIGLLPRVRRRRLARGPRGIKDCRHEHEPQHPLRLVLPGSLQSILGR
jgi:hypothetical protein